MADEKKRKKKRRHIRLRRFFAFLALVCVVAVIWLNWDYLSPEAILSRIERMGSLTGTTVSYPIDVTGRVISAVGTVGNEGFLLTDSGYMKLSRSKAEEFSHSLQNSALSISGNYALLYESGGNDYIIENTGGRIAEKTSAETIKMAEIAPNGNYALLTAVTEFANKLVIYDANGKELFSNFSTGTKISGLAFNKSGTLCAAATVDTAGGGIVSTVTVHDIAKEEPAAVLELPDLLIVRAFFDSKGGLCLICDEATVFYDSMFVEVSRVDYHTNTLLSYAWDNGQTALLFETDDPLSGRSVEVYQDGALAYSIAIDRKAKGISLCEAKLSVLDKEKLLVYDKGVLMMEKSAAAGSVRTLITTDRVFEIDLNQICIYPLENNITTQ